MRLPGAGIQDPTLLDPETRGSIEVQVRRDDYRKFLTDLVERDCPPSVRPADFLATAEALEAAASPEFFWDLRRRSRSASSVKSAVMKRG